MEAGLRPREVVAAARYRKYLGETPEKVGAKKNFWGFIGSYWGCWGQTRIWRCCARWSRRECRPLQCPVITQNLVLHSPSKKIISPRGLQRDVVYLCGPIAPLYMSPNAGGRGGGTCGISVNDYSCTHGAQINFGDLTLYLTYDFAVLLLRYSIKGGGMGENRV